MSSFYYIKKIFKRFILYQFLFIFSIIKLKNILRYKYEFSQKLKIIFEIFYINYDKFNNISLEELYNFYYCLLIVFSFLSIIFNFRIISLITGYFTIISAFLEFGPIYLMKKYYEYGKFSFLSLKIYEGKLPNLEFLLLITCGSAIIFNTFSINEKKEKNNNNNKL